MGKTDVQCTSKQTRCESLGIGWEKVEFADMFGCCFGPTRYVPIMKIVQKD